MYEQIFEFLFQTEPLFNNFWFDWLFPMFLVFMLYDFTFGIVGGLYKAGLIWTPNQGSFFHWLIRYGIMWTIIQTLIIIRDNWILIIVVVLSLGLLSYLVNRFIISKINKREKRL